ncbi:SPT48-like protein [Mya arenaria]|uniref:SPT48-like protein n=1 Tax=Mya arenaria TaxID=6604 RepID=A0ABY7DBD2_MYAAR|nr:SPT48-like protein [Mya arenaria]
MTEVFSAGTVLSDSNFKTRPHFSNYLYTDANAGGHAVNQIEEKRRIRHMKFPSLRGRCDVDSFQADLKNPGYKQWNDNGDFRAEAPYRDYDNIVDPVSGFVSAGGDVDRNTGHQKIKSLVQLNTTPQASVPKSRDSDRKSERAAPPELRRSETWEPGAPSKWNSRKTSDIWIRSQLGGWTSAHDTRKPPPEVQDMRRAKEVPWDVMLPPKQWAPTSTLEQRPDMISQTYTLHRYDPAANEWQNAGRSWDRFQKRNAYYKSAPIVFKPNIPGYQGCTLYRGQYAPAHSHPAPPNSQATTQLVHKEKPVDSATLASHKRESKMSKMVTLVPPCNPFNQINKLEEVIANKVD